MERVEYFASLHGLVWGSTDATGARFVLESDNTGPLVSRILEPMLSFYQARAHCVLNGCLEADPDRLFMKLARVVEDRRQYTGIRTLAARLLEQHLVAPPQHTVDGHFNLMWERITPESLDLIKSILLRCVQQETTERCLMLKLCDTISSQASSNIPNWPELYWFILNGLSSASPSEAALLISAGSPVFVLGCLDVRGLGDIKEVFSQILANDSLNADLKFGALKAPIKLISCLSSPEDKSIFQDLVSPIMKVTTAVMGEDEANGQEILGLLIGMDPNFLMKEQRQSWLVLGSVLDMAEKDLLEEGTRHSAIHLMTNLVESAPDKISYMAKFIERFLSLMLKMMTDIEDEPGRATSSSSDESSNFFIGKQCFTRFATAVDAYSVFPIASVLLKTYLNTPGWENKHAALIALAEISDGCSEVMNDNIEPVASMAINSVQNPHPQVRWAAANLICHLAEDCSSFSVQYRERVRTVLAPVMNDQTYPWVEERAADAYRRFI